MYRDIKTLEQLGIPILTEEGKQEALIKVKAVLYYESITKNMKIITIKPFYIIGIAVRTTNENEQAANDISALWNRFLSENIVQKIPNRVEDNIYSVYTEYEKDHTKPYTTLLGCKVNSLENVPEGMVGKSFEGDDYKVFTAKGNLQEGAVYKAWLDIWNANIKRAYTADFEVYGTKAQNPTNAEVDIFVAVKE